jgi:flagellar biosynthetic protein FlhB
MAAGGDSAQERTLEATAKRLEDARQKGDVPRSKELATALGMLMAIGGCVVFAPAMFDDFAQLAVRTWSIEPGRDLSEHVLLDYLIELLMESLWIIAPYLALMFVVSVASTPLFGGWIFSAQGVTPDLKKLDPIKGMARVLGPEGLGELVKGLVKVTFLGLVAWLMLTGSIADYIALGRMPLGFAVRESFGLLLDLMLAMTVVLILVAAGDIPWQKMQHAKKLKMSFQEVKEENKEMSGNPEVKAKIRGLQQAVSQRRMLLDVPSADVIVVNPTHYAVALRYGPDDDAPVVVAKGVDHLAMRIRAIATESRVPIHRDPPLARNLHASVKVGQGIPTELYVAVAEVLATLFNGARRHVDRASAQPNSSGTRGIKR